VSEQSFGNTTDTDTGDRLDAALHAQRPPAVADDGFSARVMAALPPAALAWAPSWRKPAVVTLWALAIAGIALSLPEVVQLLVRDAYRLFTAYPVSVPQLAFAIGAAAVVTWTATGYAVRSGFAVE